MPSHGREQTSDWQECLSDTMGHPGTPGTPAGTPLLDTPGTGGGVRCPGVRRLKVLYRGRHGKRRNLMSAYLGTLILIITKLFHYRLNFIFYTESTLNDDPGPSGVTNL